MITGTTYNEPLFIGEQNTLPNVIKFEKCQLFNDYVQSLIFIVFDTYLGDSNDIVLDQEDKIKHFEWCWNKNVNNFIDEGIHIDSEDLKLYFQKFIFDSFYNPISSVQRNKNNFSKFWSYIFSYNSNKPIQDLDTLRILYGLFEKSIILENERVNS